MGQSAFMGIYFRLFRLKECDQSHPKGRLKTITACSIRAHHSGRLLSGAGVRMTSYVNLAPEQASNL